MKLVIIEWLDSFGCSSSWQELTDDCQPKPMTCKSVGWLFRDEPTFKVIVPHIAESEVPQGCGDMTIPECCITKITEITE